MTFVSLAQAARRLGIDAKTLQRWLADAGLAVQPHPTDGRQKGLNLEQLHTLAHHHQRQLAPLPAQSSTGADSAAPALLTLSEQLAALQAQVAAVQQQLVDLTHLLQPHARPSASPEVPIRPRPTGRATSPSASPASPSRGRVSAPKTPHKPGHVLPRVEWDGKGGYVVLCPKQGLLPFEPETPEWFTWVQEQDAFRFVGKEGFFTAHHWWRVPRGAWRAHRQIRNHSYTLRLAPNHELTIAVLEQAAATLQAHLP